MVNVIPAPAAARHLAGGFVLDESTVIDAGPGTEATARWLRGALGGPTGLAPPPGTGNGGGALRLGVRPEYADRLGPEGYELHVGGNDVALHGAGPAGVFWGARTLRQLLGPDAFRRAATVPGRRWRVPGAVVEDRPVSAGAV